MGNGIGQLPSLIIFFISTMASNASKPSRVNPAAFAKSDCHTCTARKVSCDRSRPRCGICEHSDVTCGGYVMDLSWQQGFSTSRKPVKRSITRRTRRRTAGVTQFEFVSDNPVKKAKLGSLLYPANPKSSLTSFANHQAGIGEANEQLVEIPSSFRDADISWIYSARNGTELWDGNK